MDRHSQGAVAIPFPAVLPVMGVYPRFHCGGLTHIDDVVFVAFLFTKDGVNPGPILQAGRGGIRTLKCESPYLDAHTSYLLSVNNLFTNR
jgi:hypothetical protein